MIEQSTQEVDGGSKYVAEAAGKLSAMLAAVRENTALMDGIARASQQQASAIEEVGTAIQHMDEMTQHNAALVEETNAAIEQTEAQASELDQIVEIFRVAASADVATEATAPAKPAPARQRLVQAEARYLTEGNAALKTEWDEF